MQGFHSGRGKLVAAAALAFAALPAAAQVPQVVPQGMNWPSLTKSDFDLIHAAAQPLYEGHVGDSQRWRNPATQNGGRITLTRTYEMKGMPCRVMDYRIRFNHSMRQHDHYVINWCQIPDGTWKMVEERPVS